MRAHLLRTARRLRNLTMKQLADEVCIGASTIWRAENGYPVSAESRRRLCHYFSMTAQELGLVAEDAESLEGEQAAPLPVRVGAEQEDDEDYDYKPQVTADQQLLLPATVIETQQLAPFQLELNTGELSLEHYAGTWLALNATELSAFFDAGWTLDEVMNSLRVVLRSTQGMPIVVKQKLLQTHGKSSAGGAHARSTPADSMASLAAARHVSQEDREQLCHSLQQGVVEGWHNFHLKRPTEILVTTRAQLHLVQQTHDLIFPEIRYGLYAALYNLIGSALYLQGSYDAAKHAYTRAHIAALEGADIWDLAQNLTWQAVVANTQESYGDAIAYIESAQRVIKQEESERFVRLNAHLSADWALNASLLQDNVLAEEKLEDSARLLARLGPDEEFDEARWHQLAGSCMIALKQYSRAINHLETSLKQLSEPWLLRRALTLVPLAEAYMRKRDLEASLATAQQVVTLLPEVDSSMLNQRFLEYQHLLHKSFPNDQRATTFLKQLYRTPVLVDK